METKVFFFFALLVCSSFGFVPRFLSVHESRHWLSSDPEDLGTKYINPLTGFLDRLISSPSSSQKPRVPVVDTIDWGRQLKREKTSLEKLSSDLSISLSAREWFVTGNVDTSFFSKEFKFQDPDVKVSGIEQYARGVNKIFDQTCTRGQVIECRVTDNSTITVTWRLEGRVNVGTGLPVKAFYVISDLTIDPISGLIVFQCDRFAIPGWDIVLSSLFPWLPGLSPPAPPID